MYTIRLAEEKDIPELVRLRLAYLEDDNEAPLPMDKAAAVAQQLPVYFAKHMGEDCFVFVAEAEGHLVSNVILCCMEKPANLSFPSGKSGTVLGVYTEPAFRGQGCATALMTALNEKADALGLDIVKLSASRMGKPVYEKVGFVVSETHFTEMHRTRGTSV